jgi:hypothetical protein
MQMQQGNARTGQNTTLHKLKNKCGISIWEEWQMASLVS